jgi:hypothetical protein
MIYWLSAISFRVFGATTAPARLPLALSVLALAGLAFVWSKRAFGQRAAAYAALFTLTAMGVYLFTRILIPDVLLSFFIGAALYCWLTALEERSAWRWYAGYACTAAAVLTKGLVALVFIGGTAIIYVAISGEWRRWREFRLLSGLGILLAIATPWHVFAGARNRGFFWFYFVNEHFLRFLGRRYPKDYNKMPALAYWTLHLAWLFPWSFFAPTTVRAWWRRFRERRSEPSTFASRTALLCCVWAGLVLVFFAISTNQEYYTFPAYVPLLMLTAAAVANVEENGESRWLKFSHVALVVVGTAVALVLGAGLWQSRNLPFQPDIGAVLQDRDVANNTLSLSKFFDLTGASFAALRLPALVAAVAFLVGPIAALVLRLKGRPRAAIWAVGATMAGFLFAAHLALVRFGPYMSSEKLATEIALRATPADKIMIYGDQAYGSSLLFYLRRPIYLVNGRSTSMEFGSHYPDAPHIFLNDDDLRAAWAGPDRVFLFVPPERRAQAERDLPPTSKVFAESSGKLVFTNR